MQRFVLLGLALLATLFSFSQKLETVHLDAKDSTANLYIAVRPEKVPIKAFIFLMPGAFQTPQDVLQQTDLPQYAARQGILTIIPLLQTGIFTFGIDSATQQSLDRQVREAVKRYQLQGKDFYIGGFSIGGSCAVKYAQLAAKGNTAEKPKAVFGIDPPLDFERYYHAARRVVRLSGSAPVSEEITYMLQRIETEMKGTPATAPENFYNLSPYSFSDAAQRGVKALVNTPLLLVTEPDVEWWLSQRGYDYSFMNAADHAALINELQRLGNSKAVLVTTHDKGYRKPNHLRHPHSYSILDPEQLVSWLQAQ